MKSYLTQKAYRWSLVTYASPEEIQRVCEKALHYAYVLHDKDDNEPHRHVLLVFRSQRTLSAIRKDIASEQNTNGQKLRDLYAAFRYLTHEEQTDKQLYDESIIVCDDVNYWKNLKEDDGEDYETDHLLDDIITGLSYRELARRYGRDFIKNHASYIDFAVNVYKQEHGTMFEYQRIQWQYGPVKDITPHREQMKLDIGLQEGISLKDDHRKKYR